jgi:dTDP-4-dehydrorhamnose reductase
MIHVYGSTGMLGSYISDYLEREGFGIIRMRRGEILNGYVAVNCVGLIKQKMTDKDTLEAIKTNSVFPYILADHYNHVINISTDCVFSGKKGNYIETETTDAEDIYGMTKAAGEVGSVIRTSVIGEGSFKKSLLEWVKENNGNVVNGYVNHFWNGVTCLQLAKAITEVIKSGEYWDGVRHYFGETVTKMKLIEYIAKIYSPEIKICSAVAEETINRTLSTIYEGTFIEAPGIEEQLREQYEFYHKTGYEK